MFFEGLVILVNGGFCVFVELGFVTSSHSHIHGCTMGFMDHSSH